MQSGTPSHVQPMPFLLQSLLGHARRPCCCMLCSQRAQPRASTPFGISVPPLRVQPDSKYIYAWQQVYMPGSKCICLAASTYAWQQVYMPGSKYICLAASMPGGHNTAELPVQATQHTQQSRPHMDSTLLYLFPMQHPAAGLRCSATTDRRAFKSDSQKCLQK
jgi:hypothetical protein